MAAATGMVDNAGPGSVGFTLLKNGEILASHFRGTNTEINGDTLFPTASLSKWPAAYGVMLLAQARQD